MVVGRQFIPLKMFGPGAWIEWGFLIEDGSGDRERFSASSLTKSSKVLMYKSSGSTFAC